MADLVRPDGLPVFVYRRSNRYIERLSLYAEVDDLRQGAALRFEHRCAWRYIDEWANPHSWFKSCRGDDCERDPDFGIPVPGGDPIAWLLAEFTDGDA